MAAARPKFTPPTLSGILAGILALSASISTKAVAASLGDIGGFVPQSQCELAFSSPWRRAGSLDARDAESVTLQVARRTLRIGGRTAIIAGDVVFYPATSLARGLGSAWRAYEKAGVEGVIMIPLQPMKWSGKRLLGESLKAGAFLALVIAGQSMFVQYSEIEDESDEFDANDGGGQIVVADIFNPNERDRDKLFHTLTEKYFAQKYKDNSRFHYVQPATPRDLFLFMRKVAKENGAISRLEIVGHGSKGTIHFPSGTISYSDYAPTGLYGWSGHGGGGDIGYDLKVDFEQLGRETMASNAVVRLDGCNIARDKDGEKFVRLLGESLLPKGGVIVAANRTTINTNLTSGLFLSTGVDARPLRSSAERLVERGPLGVAAIVKAFMEESSVQDFFSALTQPGGVMRLEVPPEGMLQAKAK